MLLYQPFLIYFRCFTENVGKSNLANKQLTITVIQ